MRQACTHKCMLLGLSHHMCRGSEIEREIAWVIFDEVHYMQDRERGVVWEETIISLPKETKMVFLSATLSNSAQFAAWISHIRQQPCHVVYTDFRPTPLQHYAFPLGGSGLFLVRPCASLVAALVFPDSCIAFLMLDNPVHAPFACMPRLHCSCSWSEFLHVACGHAKEGTGCLIEDKLLFI